MGATTVLAAAAVGCATPDILPPKDAKGEAKQSARREVDVDVGPPIFRALALAMNAPSAHNTQPWVFELTSDYEALLYVDRARLLPETDPPSRQIHMSCGCLCEAFAVGAPTLGFHGAVELFPHGSYRETVGDRPVALLKLTPARDSASALAAHIYARRTSRLPFTGPLLGRDELERVVRDAGPGTSRHISLTGREAMRPYLEMIDAAMTIEFNTRRVNEETRRWFRFTESEATRRGDGLTLEANGISGLRAVFARWFTDNSAESWNAKGTIDAGLDGFRRAAYSSKGLVFIATDENDHVAHVTAGRDTYRLMLSATKNGLVCHPMNQVIQEYPEMSALRARFEDLSGVHAPAKVQMILRLGRSEPPYLSHRRRVRDTLR